MENQPNNVCCGISSASRVILSVLLAALAIYAAVLSVNAFKAGKYIGRETANQSAITVSGTGDVSAPSDLAVMDFSVVSESKTVSGAMDDNVKKMNAITDVVKSLGVADKDLQTSGFNINPRYDYVKQPAAVAPNSGALVPMPVDYSSGTRILAGYDLTQTLTVKIRKENMSKIGQIIQEATAAGANQVGDLRFTFDDPSAMQAQAREKAIIDAKSKAEVLAKQLGVKLVRITNYNDGGYYPVAYDSKNIAMGSAGGGAVPNVQVGENKITINVSVTYAIE